MKLLDHFIDALSLRGRFTFVDQFIGVMVHR